MNRTCEVIGWVVDDCGTRMVVREADGATSLEQVCGDGTVGGLAVQTGTFRRGKAIIDDSTQQCVGYEMERVSESFAWTEMR
jgi:hypothetical protein